MNCMSATLLLAAVLSSGLGVQEEGLVPEKPINLAARGEFEGAMAVARLKWQDRSDNELGFEILRSENGEDFVVVGLVGANTDRHDDKVGKYVNGTYIYQVRAFNEHGKSEESNAASVWF